MSFRATAFTFSSGINQQKSRILTTEDTEFTEGKSEKAREPVFSVSSVLSVV
jgi:hypothetical protein